MEDKKALLKLLLERRDEIGKVNPLKETVEKIKNMPYWKRVLMKYRDKINYKLFKMGLYDKFSI
jgi:hypothetical protein